MDESVVITEYDHGGPIGELLEPPAKSINKLRGDPLRLGMDDVSAYYDKIRTKIIELLEEILKNFSVLVMTLQATPVNVCNVCDLDQRMLPLLMILERLIIP